MNRDTGSFIPPETVGSLPKRETGIPPDKTRPIGIDPSVLRIRKEELLKIEQKATAEKTDSANTYMDTLQCIRDIEAVYATIPIPDNNPTLKDDVSDWLNGAMDQAKEIRDAEFSKKLENGVIQKNDYVELMSLLGPNYALAVNSPFENNPTGDTQFAKFQKDQKRNRNAFFKTAKKLLKCWGIMANVF